MSEYTPNHCIQYVADNMDYNIATIDGSGTFHGMGIIAAIMPLMRASTNVISKVNVTEIVAIVRITIENFQIPSTIHSFIPHLPAA